jgi:vitamin-K-epoxide reductase (warfarin-sensitive)
MSSTGGRMLWAIALLSVAGAAVSSISLYQHYGASASSFCDFGANFNCDMVNRSIYSVVFGIPVAAIGIFGYGVLLVLASLYRAKAEAPVLLLIASLTGLGFALYLTYVEAFVLAVWCILCLSSLTLIAAITVLSSVLVAQRMHKV